MDKKDCTSCIFFVSDKDLYERQEGDSTEKGTCTLNGKTNAGKDVICEKYSSYFKQEESIVKDKTPLEKLKEVVESLTENDVFLVCISRLYNDGEDKLNHFACQNNYKVDDSKISLEEFKKLLKV